MALPDGKSTEPPEIPVMINTTKMKIAFINDDASKTNLPFY